jgi:serine/threonine protein kinase
MYEGRNPEVFRRSIFLAHYEGKTVVVKFVERYSREAHENLATVNLAPALYFCSELVGGITMVVMDLVIARNAHSEFRYHHLPQTVLDDVKRGLERLHNAQLVHGDVRRANILVVKSTSRDGQSSKEEWHGQLIDFDWSGNFTTMTWPGVRYPPTLNTGGAIKWASGVEPGGEIRLNHDLEMLDMIIRGIDC